MSDNKSYTEQVWLWLTEHMEPNQGFSSLDLRGRLDYVFNDSAVGDPQNVLSGCLYHLRKAGFLIDTGRYLPVQGSPGIMRMPPKPWPTYKGRANPSLRGRKREGQTVAGVGRKSNRLPTGAPSPQQARRTSSHRDLIGAALDILSALDERLQNLEQLANSEPDLSKVDEASIWREIKRRREGAPGQPQPNSKKESK